MTPKTPFRLAKYFAFLIAALLLLNNSLASERKTENLILITLDGLRHQELFGGCLLYTSPSPRDATLSRMPSSA